jgi:hypothetical protein
LNGIQTHLMMPATPGMGLDIAFAGRLIQEADENVKSAM